jgi:hypothetical protein
VKLAATLVVISLAATVAGAAPTAPLPRLLSETGLGAPGTQAFTPRYPLWTDGAAKRRWIRLPAGASIDKSKTDAWVFPPGTKLWKEFGFDRAVETRLIERLADGSWRFATYVWNADGSDAELAPEGGVRALPVAAAPNGRYAVPSRADCLSCHEGPAVPVLGYSAVQLDTPLPPALGYLHGNCGHCHNEAGAVAGIDLVLAQRAADPAASAERTLQTLFGRESRFRAPAPSALARDEAVTHRMQTSNPYSRMPPLGVSVPDREGIALVQRWIQQTRKEISP